MPTFTPSQQERLKLLLGYASISNTLTTELSEERSQPVYDRTLEIIEELAEIDQNLRASRPDTMARQVGQMAVSYPQHVAMQKNAGQGLLVELGDLLGIEVISRKYRRSRSVVSYW